MGAGRIRGDHPSGREFHGLVDELDRVQLVARLGQLRDFRALRSNPDGRERDFALDLERVVLGCNFTVHASGTWTLNLPSESSAPSSGAATLSIPAGGLTIAITPSCILTSVASIVGTSGTFTWTDGGSLHDQDQPPDTQIRLSNAGTIMFNGCLGTVNATMSGTYNLVDTDSPVALWAGVGAFAVNPNPLKFPDTTVNTTATRNTSLRNSSDADITIIKVNVVGDNVFAVDVGAGITIKANSSSAVPVTFTPKAVQPYKAKIEFVDGNGTVQWTVEVSGKGK